jgi:hypothetical protein
MDEVWCTDLVFPGFIQPDWAAERTRFLALHILLAYLDERDRQTLPAADYVQLASARPCDWLPFMSDPVLAGWRDLIAAQIAPGAASQTLDILGKRLGMPAAELGASIDSRIDELVWSNIAPARVHAVEEAMYTATRGAVIAYLNGSAPQP